MLILFQIILYFASKYIESKPHLITTFIDKKIPFVSMFIYFYFIWYIMLVLVPLTISKYDMVCFKKYCIMYFLSLIISVTIFIIYPTTIIRPEISVNDFNSFLVNFVYTNDTPAINCFPSIHCLMCFLFIISSICCNKMPNIYKILIITVSILIVISTLLIHQHVIYDVLGSVIIINTVYILLEKFKLYKILK